MTISKETLERIGEIWREWSKENTLAIEEALKREHPLDAVIREEKEKREEEGSLE